MPRKTGQKNSFSPNIYIDLVLLSHLNRGRKPVKRWGNQALIQPDCSMYSFIAPGWTL